MKLAFCLFKYFPYGGLQRDFRAIVQTCLARGHQVDVYTFEWIGPSLPGINIKLLKKTKLTNYQNYWRFSQKVVNELNQQGYDAIVGFNKMAGLDVYYAADPCFEALSENRNFIHKINPRYHYFKKLESAIFHPMAHTQVLTLVEKQQHDFYQHYHTSSDRFHLMPPWLDDSRFPPKETASIKEQLYNEFGLAGDDKLILFVGSGFKVKGLDRAINAVNSLPEDIKKQTHLFVIGDDKTEIFEKLAKQYSIEKRVRFLGGRGDIPRFMFSADLLLHPALAENAGYVLLEAIVAGLPVLTTDTCGFASHVISAGAGTVIESPYQQKNLNEALSNMLTDFESIQTWRKNGLLYPKHCNLKGMPNLATDLIEWTARLPKARKRKVNDSFFVYPELMDMFSNDNTFSDIMNLQGEIYRNMDGRKTLAFKHGNKRYFAKLHSGVGWREIWKNLFNLRIPIISAKNEFKAIKFFEKINLHTTPAIGFGSKGLNPAKKQSFLITKALENTISLEDLTKDWKDNPPDCNFKRKLIYEIARIAKLMHENGINHRDFYICHFLLDLEQLEKYNKLRLYVIDLHRAQIRRNIPFRWQVKDIASLYYSSLDIGLTKRDYVRFIQAYTGMSIKKAMINQPFWDEIITKTYKLTNRAFKFDTEVNL